MANEDVVRFKGAGKEYKDDRAGAATIPSAVLGIVKNNIDPTKTGRIEVALKRMATADQDSPSSWVTVRYLSPFFGYTPNTGSPDSSGDFVGNPNSYGFWATPPDIGSEVVCVFLNGDPNEGYYIGGVPQPGLTHMTPAIAASDNIIPNSGEAQSYGGATRLPSTEFNNANDKQSNSLDPSKQPRPVHSYQAAIFNKQGLLRDTVRGPISSSSSRESPSRVFGMSTPGRPIFNGGYDDKSIQSATSGSGPDKNFQVIGRTGGHTFVMDDGDIAGKDQLTRIRTSSGHMIMMNDSAQTLFIVHANGQSYIELGKEGTIDLYSTNSVNIRTQGDLNLHADNNVNICAGKDINLNAGQNTQIESEKVTNLFAGTDFAQYVKGNFTTQVDGGMSMASKGEASYASSSKTYINGPDAVNLNTGASGLTPKAIKQITKIKHPDTLYDSQKGFASAPAKLESITSRAPAHSPWENANKGVDVKTNLSASANLPAAASPAVQKVNTSAPPAPTAPTSPTVAATVPKVNTPSSLDTNSASALTSQMAVNAATGPTADAVKQGAGIVNVNGTSTAVMGATALNPTQMAAAGYIKPGMDDAINAAVASGKSLNEAIPPNAWTGKGGVNSLGDFIDNKNAQVDATQTLLDKSNTALIQNRVIIGRESVAQTGGLIMATASVGVGPVSEYVNSNAGGLGLKMPSTSATMPSNMNSASGSVGNLIAGGALAAGVASQLAGGLKSLSGADSLAAGMFAKLMASFKSLQAGVPQSLSAAASDAEAAVKKATPDVAAAASEASKGLTTASSDLNVSSMMDKAFASAKSMTPSLDKVADNVMNSTGLASIKNSISQISGAASGLTSTVSSVTSDLTAKMGINSSLTSFATAGLKTPDMSALESAVGALGKPGAVDVKLPTVAEGTNDVAALEAQSKSLLGNPKIPSIKIT